MVTTTFSMERVMDLLAGRTGLDPAEVRRRNLISDGDFPYRNVLGVAYERASFQESLTAGLAAAGYEGFRAEQERARAQGRRLGLGIAVYAEFTAPNSKALAWRGIVRVPGFDSVLAPRGPERQGARLHERHRDGARDPDRARPAHRRRAGDRHRRRHRRDRGLHPGALRQRRLREPRGRGGRRRGRARRAPGAREDRGHRRRRPRGPRRRTSSSAGARSR